MKNGRAPAFSYNAAHVGEGDRLMANPEHVDLSREGGGPPDWRRKLLGRLSPTTRVRLAVAVTMLFALGAWAVKSVLLRAGVLHNARRPTDDSIRPPLALTLWDGASSKVRKTLSMQVAAATDGFSFVRLEPQRDGKESREIAVFKHDPHRVGVRAHLWRFVPHGSPEDEAGRSDHEGLHRVTLSRPFLLCRTECT